MIDLPARHLATVRRILDQHAPDCEARVFGSRACGTAKPYSDLDLILVGQGPAPFETMRLLKEAFEESDLPFRVDIVDWHRVSEGFRQAVAGQCVPIETADGQEANASCRRPPR